MKKHLKILAVNISALLLGLLLSFAFAPYDFFPLAIIAIAGLLGLWISATPKQAFILGLLFGIGLFGVSVYWVYIGIHIFGEVSILLSSIITAGLVVALAFFPATAGYLTTRFFPHNQTLKYCCAFPAIWVLIEWLRSFVMSGFPWLLLGYSQTNSPLKGYAPIFSVYGVSLGVLVLSGLIVSAVIALNQKRYHQLYTCLFVFVSILIGGAVLDLIPWTKSTGEPITVSMVQGNIPQTIKWDPEQLQLSYDRYESLTTPLWGKSKLIIWPETAIPTTLQDAASYINKMDALAKKNNTKLILGIPIYQPKNNGYYNAVVTLGNEHKIYLKRHLVPFGEYVPLENLLTRILNFLNIPTSILRPGNIEQGPLILNNIPILTAICYEIAFPELVNTNDTSVGLILALTNDAWFGKSAAQAQHLQMASMRAIELRRPVLVVSNDGITALVAQDGSIITSAPPYQAYVLNTSVQPRIGLTPWMQNGMDPVLFLSCLLLFVAYRTNKNMTATHYQPKVVSYPIKE